MNFDRTRMLKTLLSTDHNENRKKMKSKSTKRTFKIGHVNET